jgi:hypothetical protein
MTVRKRWATTRQKVCQDYLFCNIAKVTLTCQEKRVVELLAYRGLNLSISGKVNARRSLIQNNDRTATKKCTSHSNQLPLALREVCASSGYLCVEGDGDLGVDFCGAYRRV